MPAYLTPGVYKEEFFPEAAAALQTGVPAFLGFTRQVAQDAQGNAQFNVPQRLTLWPQFVQNFGAPLADGYLGDAVRGFFENGGHHCYVVPLDPALPVAAALQAGLAALTALDTVDLVCAPDLMRLRQPGNQPPDPDEVRALQTALLQHCDTVGDRLAILDALPAGAEASPQTQIEAVREQRRGLHGVNGALYFPWLGIRAEDGTMRFVPPCGHVAGVYARSDDRAGVHKAPANEVVEGVLDLSADVTAAQQGELNPEGINALRAFPGRGIRIWGARTLSTEPAWTYVSVRRLFLTAGRWIERNLASATFEPNDPNLWARIRRELTAYFNGLFQRGALKGATPEEAFFVKCDGETNPPAVRDAGQVITEIGLAPGLPNEFVIVRIIHGPSGITLSGPER
jgi:phage tail sheath protein FI